MAPPRAVFNKGDEQRSATEPSSARKVILGW